jgi:hypothetical protein
MSFFKKIFGGKSNKNSKKSHTGQTKTNIQESIVFDEEEFLKPKTEDIDGNYLIHSFVSEVETKDKDVTLSCKSFLTEGMRKVGQQEVILTLVIPSNPNHKQYLQLDYIVPLFNVIYQYAEKGMIVTEGHHSSFSGNSNILGYKGVVYAQHPEKASEKVPDDCLSIVLLHQNEKIIAMEMGYMRILTMLGRERFRYPFPIWNELQRPEATLLEDMYNRTVLKQSLTKVTESKSVVYHAEKTTRFEISKSFFKSNKSFWDKSPFKTGHIVFLPSFDLDILSCITWSDKPDMLNGMTGAPPDEMPTPVKMMGCILMIVGSEEKDEIVSYEDGFAVFMTENSWNNFTKSFKNKDNFTLEVEPVKNDFFKSECFELIWKD